MSGAFEQTEYSIRNLHIDISILFLKYLQIIYIVIFIFE